MEKIMKLWAKMPDETKKSAIERLMEVFYLTSFDYVRQEWIYGRNVPKAKRKKVEEIFKEELETVKN